MVKHIFTALLLTVLTSASCVREDAPLSARAGEMTITAGFEGCEPAESASKTYLVGNEVRWLSGAVDKVLYVFDTQGVKNVFTSTATSASPTRVFTGTISEGSAIQYVLWSGKTAANDNSELIEVTSHTETVDGDNEPIGEGGSIEFETRAGSTSTRTVIGGSSLELAATQSIFNANSFAQTANIAVMKPGDTVLRNVFGYIRFTIPAGEDNCATIKSVTFSADEDLSGQIQIDYNGEEPTTRIVADGGKSITVNTRYNDKIPGYEAGTLFAVLPVGTYHNFKVTVTPFADGAVDKNAATGEPYSFTSKNPVLVKRGQYTDAGTLKPDMTPDPEQVVGEIKRLETGGAGALCIDGNLLYAGKSGKILVYDISTPLSPRLVNTVNFTGSARQMTSYQGKLYVTARETGVWIFDLSADPQSPALLTRFDSVELATGVDAAGNCLFVGQRQNGVEFIDVTNPSAPAHIRMIKTNESQSVFYRNGYLYSGEWGAGKITIFDARDLSNIQLLKQIDLQGFGDGLWIQGNRMYVSTGHHHRNQTPKTQDGDGHGVEIWDVTDPVNPVFISRTEFDIFYQSGSDWWLPRPAGDGKTLFCGDVYNGLYILDITDETAPQILYRYTPSAGKAVNSIAVGDGALYMGSGDGLFVMECPRAVRSTRDRGTLPVNASARYTYTTASDSHFKAWMPSKRGGVRSAAAWGDALIVGCGNAGLAIVKLDSSGNPYTYSTIDLPYAGGVAVRGNRLYVSLGENGVGVYSITAGPVLTRIATVKEQLSTSATSQFSCWVSAPNDKYLVNGARSVGYQFLSIGGTETSPTFTYRAKTSLNVNYNKFVPEQVCGNDKFPYATRSGLIWIDLSSTSTATVAPTVTDIKNGLTDGVTHFKDGNALITASGYFYLVEPGASVIKAASSSKNSNFDGIPRWDGDDSVIISNFLGLYITKADVSSISSPTQLYKETTQGHPEPGLFWNGKAVVPCGYQGLLIEK